MVSRSCLFIKDIQFAVLVSCLVGLCAASPSDGCTNYDQPPLKPGSPSYHFSFNSSQGGGERHVLLNVPRAYRHGVPVPLILAFHGKHQTPKDFEYQTQLSNPEFVEDAVVVYPEGVNAQWTGDPTAPLTSEIDDVQMVVDLLDHLLENLCVDTARIHAYGFSNGGGLVDLLACDPSTSQRFASFAATSPAVYKDVALREPLFSTCPSAIGKATPMLWFFGTKDPVIDIGGKDTPDGETYPVEQRMKGWAGRNGCDIDRPKVMSLHDGRVEWTKWSGQRYGRDVVQLYKVKGWGHGVANSWSMDNDYQRYGPTPFDGTSIIMDFFKAWPAGAMGEPYDRHERDEL
ncbi:hypothetical protein AAFC00_002481 [Neodothiora populina]|uniref:feruloyl esterase n=1 Tax=Neodothiora populina TaxID=2781224 RepID=A0ABR3P7I5_9PEZI